MADDVEQQDEPTHWGLLNETLLHQYLVSAQTRSPRVPFLSRFSVNNPNGSMNVLQGRFISHEPSEELTWRAERLVSKESWLERGDFLPLNVSYQVLAGAPPAQQSELHPSAEVWIYVLVNNFARADNKMPTQGKVLFHLPLLLLDSPCPDTH